MKANQTTSALFCYAFGSASLEDGVFSSGQAVTREDACIALCAGYLAKDKFGSNLLKAQASKDSLFDKAEEIMYGMVKPGTKENTKPRRTAAQQGLYMRVNAKYLYFFSDGASSSSKKGAKAKSKAKAPKLNPWQELVVEYLSQHPAIAKKIALELGLEVE